MDVRRKRLKCESDGTIRHYIQSNRALAKFNISDNKLCGPGTKTLAGALKGNQIMTELNISRNGMGWDDWYNEGSDMSGVEALASAIPTMGALVKFDISDNNLRAEGGKALGEALKDNQIMQELNIASNELIHKADAKTTADIDMSGVIAISDAIPTMGALVKFDISNNLLGAEGVKALGEALKGNGVMTDLNLASNYAGLKPGGKSDMSGVSAISDAIHTMGALVKFDFSNNELRADGGKAIAGALKNNNIMKELNIARNNLGKNSSYDQDVSGVLAICDAICTNGSLEKLLMAKNKMGTTKSGKALGMALSKNTVLKELDVSVNKYYNNGWKTDPGFASEIANGINNNGAIATVNIMGNNIGKDMITAHPTLVSLCGIADNATEVDLSGLQMNASDAAILADELPAKRALTSLNISNNNIGQIVGWKDYGPLSDSEACGSAYSEAPDNHRYTHTDGRHQAELPEGDELGKPEGFIAIVNAIPTMGKIAYLNLRRNGRLDEAAYEALRNMWKTCMTNYAFNELPSIRTDTPMDEKVNSLKAFFARALPGRTNMLRNNLLSEPGLLVNIVEYLI